MSLKTEVAPTFGTFLDAVLVEGVSTTILPIGEKNAETKII